MDPKTKTRWLLLGNRLATTDADKFKRVVHQLQDIVEAEDLISGFDHQLILRSQRPRKRYLA